MYMFHYFGQALIRGTFLTKDSQFEPHLNGPKVSPEQVDWLNLKLNQQTLKIWSQKYKGKSVDWALL